MTSHGGRAARRPPRRRPGACGAGTHQSEMQTASATVTPLAAPATRTVTLAARRRPRPPPRPPVTRDVRIRLSRPAAARPRRLPVIRHGTAITVTRMTDVMGGRPRSAGTRPRPQSESLSQPEPVRSR